MEKMSRTFQEAFSMADYNEKEAIRLYNKELNDNPDNFAALHNRGLCKLRIAIKEKNKALVEESKFDFITAIEMANQHDGKDFSIARANLKWAEEIASESSTARAWKDLRNAQVNASP